MNTKIYVDDKKIADLERKAAIGEAYLERMGAHSGVDEIRDYLLAAEIVYLTMRGWVQVPGEDKWLPPRKSKQEHYRLGHAVNSQKADDSLRKRWFKQIEQQIEEEKAAKVQEVTPAPREVLKGAQIYDKIQRNKEVKEAQQAAQQRATLERIYADLEKATKLGPHEFTVADDTDIPLLVATLSDAGFHVTGGAKRPHGSTTLVSFVIVTVPTYPSPVKP